MDLNQIKEIFAYLMGRQPSLPPRTVAPEPKPIPAVKGWSKDMADCHPLIRDNYEAVKARFIAKHPECSLKVDYTYRDPALQFELFKKGRTLQNGEWVLTDPENKLTNCDGTKIRSHHNTWPSQAADVYITRNGVILWGQGIGESDLYISLGKEWDAVGLVSGATWRYKWKDPNHVQVAYTII